MKNLKESLLPEKNGYKRKKQINREQEWEKKLREDNVKFLKEEFGHDFLIRFNHSGTFSPYIYFPQ